MEDLAPGDRASARFAGIAPIKWIGHRHVDCARHPDPRSVWPVRIKQGAFADELPCRDLLVSPDHAVYCCGNLIPARRLVNGASIVQERRDEAVYYHVELDRHDLLLAEGLLVESYLDTGNRGAFENGASPIPLHSAFASNTGIGILSELGSCVPLADDPDAVEQILARTSRSRRCVGRLFARRECRRMIHASASPCWIGRSVPPTSIANGPYSWCRHQAQRCD